MTAPTTCLPQLLERAGLGRPLADSPRHPVAILTRGPAPVEVAALWRTAFQRVATAVQILEADLPADHARAGALAVLTGELE